MGSLNPRRQLPGLLPLIDNDEGEVIPLYTHLDSVLTSGLTCIGAFEHDGRTYRDAGFEQYAIIHRKPKALKALLEQWRTLDNPAQALGPRFANVKMDLFTLAIQLEAGECLDVLIEFAVRIHAIDSCLGPDKRTPLMVAVSEAKWEAVHMLIKAGASFFESQNGRCAFIDILLNHPEYLGEMERVLGETFTEPARRAVIDCLWDQSTLTRSPDGRPLVDIWSDRHSQDEKGREGLDWLRRISPPSSPGGVAVVAGALDVLPRHRREDGPPADSRACDVDGCEHFGSDQCNRCRKWFCEGHAREDDHGCQETA
jgi:hypothetical protein